MRATLLPGVMVAALGLCSGCASRGNTEVLEAQLRSQETMIRSYERQLSQLRTELAASQREIDIVRGEIAQLGHQVAAEESSSSLARVEGLAFNTLLTAGQNRDGIPGDERFYAVVYPHDSHGELVKLSGRLEVEAIDLARPEDKTIGRWQFSAEEARRLWHAGFLTSGYELDLEWQQPPVGSKVLLLVKLITPDGRSFEATQNLVVENVGSMPLHQVKEAPRRESISPSQLQQARFEKEAEHRPVPDLTPDEFWPTERSELAKRDPSSRPTASDAPPKTAAKPFPSNVTSDNWNDGTIPQWR